MLSNNMKQRKVKKEEATVNNGKFLIITKQLTSLIQTVEIKRLFNILIVWAQIKRWLSKISSNLLILKIQWFIISIRFLILCYNSNKNISLKNNSQELSMIAWFQIMQIVIINM